MKYQQTSKRFKLKGKIVQPFNGEKVEPFAISWSHGLTHFKDEAGAVSWCGMFWFEKHAQEVVIEDGKVRKFRACPKCHEKTSERHYERSHECPYQVDLYDNHDECNCCTDCISQCQQDT